MRRCPMCHKYVKLEDWPTYNGKLNTYCLECKRTIQREWIRNKREMQKKK